MFKKIAALSMALVMTLCLTACSGLPPAVEIIENVAQAMDSVKTYQFELDISIDIASETEGYEESINMSYDGVYDLENMEMKLDIIADMTSLTSNIDMSMVMYIIDGVAYMTSDDQGADPVWEMAEVEDVYLEEISQVESQLELLDAVQVEVIDSENVEGIDCYVLKITPDVRQMLDLTMMQSWSASGDVFSGIDEELLLEMFNDFSLKQWIAKDTYFITKVEMDISMVYPEDNTTTLEVAMDLLVHDYNQPVSIVLPSGAEDAIAASE